MAYPLWNLLYGIFFMAYPLWNLLYGIFFMESSLVPANSSNAAQIFIAVYFLPKERKQPNKAILRVINVGIYKYFYPYCKFYGYIAIVEYIFIRG
ncbi:hypothetical protein HYU13_01695 [Candidatus Woesearchaeota archaeon]|nr:hypothetical protein [Candidatus Woesearchaeota archaeon]